MLATPPPTPNEGPVGPWVHLGQVLTGAVPFKQGNINDTYRGVILTKFGERTAVIKDIESKELANEVLSAAIALQLGLPVPPPYIAFAHPGRFLAKKGPELGEGRLVYASVDVAQPQVAMLYSADGGDKVLGRLARWSNLGRLYGFDALVANIDRHAGNILFSGDREVWLIDHGWCFTGPNWQPADLTSPEQPVVSRLSGWLTPVLDEQQRNETAREAARVEVDAAKMDIRRLALTNYVSDLLTDGDLEAVLTFINGRFPHVPRLAASDLGIDKLL